MVKNPALAGGEAAPPQFGGAFDSEWARPRLIVGENETCA